MRAVLVGLVSLVAIAVLAPTASAVDVRFQTIAGVNSPGTPPQYNRVGILQTGPRSARNILVLNPGTSASSAYFEPLAKTIVVAWSRAGRCGRSSGARTCSRTSRCSTPARRARRRRSRSSTTTSAASRTRASSPTSSSSRTPRSATPATGAWTPRSATCARSCWPAETRRPHAWWSAATRSAARSPPPTRPGTSTARPGADGLSGLVYIDGGSRPVPVTPDRATQLLQKLHAGSPWLTVRRHPRAVYRAVPDHRRARRSCSTRTHRRWARRSRSCRRTSSRRFR